MLSIGDTVKIGGREQGKWNGKIGTVVGFDSLMGDELVEVDVPGERVVNFFPSDLTVVTAESPQDPAERIAALEDAVEALRGNVEALTGNLSKAVDALEVASQVLARHDSELRTLLLWAAL